MTKILLEILQCPSCYKRVTKLSNKSLICMNCKTVYPIKDDIPIFINTKKLQGHLQHQVYTFHNETHKYGNAYKLEDWQKKYVNFILKNIKIKPRMLALDNGCGSAYATIELAKRGVYIVATDINMSGLIRLNKIAKRMNIENRILAVCCTSEYLPIKNNTMNIINMNAVLEHLPNETSAIKELTRVAKRGCISLITVPQAYQFIHPLLIPINLIHDKRIGHLRRYTVKSLQHKFHKWNLKNVYFIGHAAKVFKTIINMIVHLYDTSDLEDEDMKFITKRWSATNVCVAFVKK